MSEYGNQQTEVRRFLSIYNIILLIVFALFVKKHLQGGVSSTSFSQTSFVFDKYLVELHVSEYPKRWQAQVHCSES